MNSCRTKKPDGFFSHYFIHLILFDMSTTAGVFSETALRNIRMRADAIQFDEQLKKDFTPRIDIINAMRRANTARMLPLQDGRKNYTVELMWMNACAIEATACDTCTFDGVELSTNVETYALDQCKQADFTVNHYDFWSNDFGWEEAVAKGMMTAEIRLIEQVVWTYLTTLNTNAGVNQWGGDVGIATIVGNETRINPVNYHANIISYLLKVAQFNQMGNPLMMSGNLLWDDYYNAQFNATGYNTNDGNQSRFSSMDWFWDVWNFNVLGFDLYQFMVQVGATAFASRGIYGSTPEYWAEADHWSAPSMFFPELIIDWSRKITCVNDMKNEVYVGKAHWGHFVNPTGCNAEVNGILQFHAV